jgi:hypothetical protein
MRINLDILVTENLPLVSQQCVILAGPGSTYNTSLGCDIRPGSEVHCAIHLVEGLFHLVLRTTQGDMDLTSRLDLTVSHLIPNKGTYTNLLHIGTLLMSHLTAKEIQEFTFRLAKRLVQAWAWIWV